MMNTPYLSEINDVGVACVVQQGSNAQGEEYWARQTYKEQGDYGVITMKFIVSVIVLLAAHGASASCELTISAADLLEFDKKEMEVSKSCGTVKVTFNHTGNLPKNIMGHNWVLSKPEDLTAVAQEGMAAGLDNSYITAGDARVIAFTQVIGGGESTSIEFSVADLAEGDYAYYCTFPGHWAVMKGILRVNP